MLHTTIVPEGDRLLGPAEAALEQRLFGVLIQIGQYRIALIAWNTNDMGRKAAIHVERLFLPSPDTCARQGAPRADSWFVYDTRIHIKAAINHLSVVNRGQTLEISLQPL
jgi:hypothetical protein